MATDVETYDPRQVACLVGGRTMEGFAPDTFVTITRNNDMFVRTTGCDGTTARAKTNDKTAKIKIILMQTSPSNDILSAYAAADELSNAGAVPFGLKDNNGTTLCAALTAWVMKPADVEFGGTIAMREWTLETGSLDMFVGGQST